MTQDREEQLINDVAWMRGNLETYFKDVAPTLATKESVDAVDRRITDHCEGHKDNRNMVPVWLGVAGSWIIGIAGILFSFIGKGGVK